MMKGDLCHVMKEVYVICNVDPNPQFSAERTPPHCLYKMLCVPNAPRLTAFTRYCVRGLYDIARGSRCMTAPLPHKFETAVMMPEL